MRRLGASGIWEIFIPDLGPGALYKYEIRKPARLRHFSRQILTALYTEIPPATSSVVYQPNIRFHDGEWIERRARAHHCGSPSRYTKCISARGGASSKTSDRSLTYRETRAGSGRLLS